MSIKTSKHLRSIVSLCESSTKRREHPDIAAICVLARCVIEARNAAAYLLEHNIPKEEAHLRLHLVGLNQSIDLLRVERGLQTNKSDFWSEHSIAYSREQLEGNPVFAALDAEHRKSLLRGKSPFQHARYCGKRPLSVAQESAIYTLLSHSAHSFALGLHWLAGFGSATAAGATNSFKIATLAAQIYAADAAQTYCKFRRRALGRLAESDANTLAEASNPAALLELLCRIRAEALT